jgi:hypothetical protein
MNTVSRLMGNNLRAGGTHDVPKSGGPEDAFP